MNVSDAAVPITYVDPLTMGTCRTWLVNPTPSVTSRPRNPNVRFAPFCTTEMLVKLANWLVKASVSEPLNAVA